MPLSLEFRVHTIHVLEYTQLSHRLLPIRDAPRFVRLIHVLHRLKTDGLYVVRLLEETDDGAGFFFELFLGQLGRLRNRELETVLI